MKKVLVLLSAAALVLVSCAKVKDVYTGSPESRQIAFSPLAKPATKAVDNNDAFPTGYNFYIAAYAAATGADYFGSTEFQNETGTTTWSGVDGSKKYWPLNPETLNFLAVTKAGSSTTTFGTANANYASKVVVELADNRTAQHDLMYASARATNPNSNVSLAFHHALSWVQFTVAGTAGTGLAVNSIQLKGAAYTGTLTVNLANYNSSSETLTATPSWDGEVYAAATKYDVTVPGVSSPITVNATPQSVGDGLLVVPNPTVNAASISSFVVNYTLNGHNYNIEHTPAENQVMYPGYKYIYNISFTTHEIKVTATVADWDATTQHGASI